MCRIGRHALLKIDNFSIEHGQHWCIFGPNGAGKTLLANLLAGKRVESGTYVSYAEGFDFNSDIYTVSFEEQRRLWQRDMRLDISEFSVDLVDQGTVVEDLIRSSRSTENQDEKLLQELQRRLALKSVFKQGIRFLSSGQTRKVLIARALYGHHPGRPKLVILDEPLESIDKDSRQQIAECIEHYLDDDCCSLHLCRRQQDMLPHITHMALMNDFTITKQGIYAELSQSKAFVGMVSTRPMAPLSIPGRLKVDEPSAKTHGDATQSPEVPIRLENVSASYGDHRVLANITWTMELHHQVLIEGPNGCGKSTLLSLIDGENHKGYGQDVFLFGQRKGSGESVWDVKAKFGVVSNELHNKYVKGWRVLEVVVSGFFDSVGLYDESGSAERDLAKQWLTTLGIVALQQHYYHELSFGQQRLVLLARAMVKHPRVLILDEPCVGLDNYHRRLILQTLDIIVSQTNTQIIYVSHVLGEQPDCINQRLSFVEIEGGSFTLELQGMDQPRI